MAGTQHEFNEEQTVYAAEVDAQALVGQLRSIGPDGPTYEVLQIVYGRLARILVPEAEREVEYPIEDILTDPGPDSAWKSP